MKKISLIILFVLPFFLNAQITIDKNDMPEPGDTFRISTAIVFTGDPELTGANYLWDFSNLTANMQRVDSFTDPADAPGLYAVVFNSFTNPNRATVAINRMDSINFIPNLPVTNPMDFFKNSNEFYGQVGIGITVSGLALPIQYSTPEEIYKFPMDYLDSFDDSSSYQIAIPTLGYFSEELYREAVVDGWGTLKLPMGNFDVLRVKSLITRSDSVYVEATGIGLALPPVTTTEYHWLAKQEGIPLLRITTALTANTTVNYRDLPLDTATVGIKEPVQLITETGLFPNPSSGDLNLNYSLQEATSLEVDLLDYSGRTIARLKNENQVAGRHTMQLSLNEYHLEKGVYYILLNAGDVQKHIPFLLLD